MSENAEAELSEEHVTDVCFFFLTIVAGMPQEVESVCANGKMTTWAVGQLSCRLLPSKFDGYTAR